MAFVIQPPRFESSNSDAPFKRSAQEIKELFFASAEEKQIGNFTLWKDGSAGTVLVQELIDWDDANNNGKIDQGEEVRENFNLLIFVSKDKSYLEEAYRNYDPDDWELCLFLEDNSTDTFSGTYSNLVQQDITEEDGESILNIKVNGRLEPVLERWLNKEYSAFVEVLQKAGLDIDLSKEQLKQLMTTGSLQNADFAFAKGILGMISKTGYFVGSIYVTIGDAILGATKFVREYTRIQEYQWNPQKGTTDDGKTKVDNSSFTPFLLPFTQEFIDFLAQYPNEAIGEMVDGLEKELQKVKSKAHRKFNRLHKLSGVKVVIRKDLKKFMKSYEDYVDNAFTVILSSVREIVPLMANHGKKTLNVINAFYCGLWNSFVEALLGIVDLIGFLFKGCGLVYNGVGVLYEGGSNFDELLPEVLELMDETYQSVLKADFRALFFEIVAGLMTLLSAADFSQMAPQFNISMEQVAYYTGAIVGFVIELILGFVSGGGTTVAGTMNKFGSTGKKALAFFEGIFDTVFGAAAKVGQISLDICIEILKTLIDILKKGPVIIRQLVDELVELLRYGFKNVQDFLQALQAKFDDFLRKLPNSPWYTPNEVDTGWKTIKSMLDEDEFADLGKTVFCSLA